MKDLNQIANEYKWGSRGFIIAIETYCGYNMSRTEIERIADRTSTPDEFQTMWENDVDWLDEEE